MCLVGTGVTRDVCAHTDRWLGHGQYVTVRTWGGQTDIRKLILFISKVVDTPGFGNSLEEEEVSARCSDAVVDLELPGVSSPYLISAGLTADMSHQVGLQQEASQTDFSPVF